MNTDRIKRLARQAYAQACEQVQQSDIAHWYSDRGPPSDMVNQKFAELLIQECYVWVKYNGGLSSEFDLQALKAHLGMEP